MFWIIKNHYIIYIKEEDKAVISKKVVDFRH